jgi:hypothetical protein
MQVVLQDACTLTLLKNHNFKSYTSLGKKDLGRLKTRWQKRSPTCPSSANEAMETLPAVAAIIQPRE